MWSNWAESAMSSMTQVLEKTGDAISKAATQAGKQAGDTSSNNTRQPQPTIVAIPGVSSPVEACQSVTVDHEQGGAAPTPGASKHDLFTNISDGWNSVVTSTRVSVQKAEEKLKEQQQKLKEQLSKARSAFYKRDPSLPLDVKALKDAEVIYVTDRLITMGHPAMASQVNPEISGERKLAAIGHLLNRRHAGRYMVWNLSEVDYDIEILDEQVLTYSFPGSPSPPLGLLLKLLVAMESWLKADPRNVAVVHCLTGKGRTSLVLAAFLCWTGEAQFSDIYDALDYIAKTKQVDPDELTIPSQRRYASYFKNMLDGIRPSQPPLMLKRIIMSEAPKFARGIARNEDKSVDEALLMGCVPYIQIFKAGELLHTAPASLHPDQAANELPFCQVADGNICFHTNLMIQGDILVRARHLTASRKRLSMFRVAFHTGYAPSNVMRLTKLQLDGACDDNRFSPDFFIDLIFEPADAEEASKLLEQGVASNKDRSSGGYDDKKNHAVQASPDDTMLHRDSRFWNVIASRMKENSSEKSSDPMCGPTVGRRRDFAAVDESNKNSEQKESCNQADKMANETFSIGGDFDFLSETVEEEAKSTFASSTPKQDEAAQPAEKDSLMEALMGAIDDLGNLVEDNESEVIVFDNDGSVKAPLVDRPEDKQLSNDSSQPPAAVDSGLDDFMADLNVEYDMNAILGVNTDLKISEEDLMNMEIDVDDPDLQDLESFLSPKNSDSQVPERQWVILDEMSVATDIATSALSSAAAAPPELDGSMEVFLDMSVEAPLVFVETTDTQPPSLLAFPAPGPLVHRLMENVEAPKELDRVYDRDYLALRYRAFTNRKGGTDPWKGATILEKALISCVDEHGALRRDRVIHFIGHITECSKNWALPLAILERSQKEDEEDAKLAAVPIKKTVSETSKTSKKPKRGKRKRDEDEDSDYSEKGYEDEDEEDEWQSQGDSDEVEMNTSFPPSNGSVQALPSDVIAHKQSFETKTVTEMSPQVVKVQTPQIKTPRMELFVQLGGLKILSVWLAETKEPETKTGSLTLPLLALIAKVPFSFQAIERSKINKTILSIKREIKKLKSLDNLPKVHAVSGNNPIDDVLNALNKIIKLWKEKTVANKKSSQTLKNPLADFEEKMMNHIRKIEEERAKRLSEDAAQAFVEGKRLSVREREKIERFNEFEAGMLRRDLEKVQRDRAEANRKFHESQARREPPKPPPRIGARSVRWKDGLRTGKANPELLVSVRVYNTNQTAAGEDVAVDPEEEAKIRANKDNKEGSDSLRSGKVIAEQHVSVQEFNKYHEQVRNVPVDLENETKRRAIEPNEEVSNAGDTASVHHYVLDQPLRHGRGSAQYSRPKVVDLTDSPDDENCDGAADVQAEAVDERDRASGSKFKKRFKKKHKQFGPQSQYTHYGPQSQHPTQKTIYGGRKKKHFNNKWKSGNP